MTFRRKRLVRLHLDNDAPSIEGVFAGFWADHYIIRVANLITGPDSSDELDGHDVRVPRGRVVFMQVLQR